MRFSDGEDLELEQERRYRNRDLLKRFWPYLKPHLFSVFTAGLIMLTYLVLDMMTPLLIRHGIDHDIRYKNLDALGMTVLAYLLIQSLAIFLQFRLAVFLETVGQKILTSIKSDVFGHLLGLSINFYDANPVGKLLTRVESDSNTLRQLLSQTIISLGGSFLWLIGMMVVMLAVEWKLALITFTLLPLMAGLVYWFQVNAKPRFRRARKLATEISGFVTERLGAVNVIQAFCVGDAVAERLEKRNQNNFETRLDAEKIAIVFFNGVQIMEIAGLSMILWFGGQWAISGEMTIGTLVMFLGYIQRFFRPLLGMSEQFTIIQRAFASADRIFSLLDTRINVPESERPIEWDGNFEKISFESVWFAYKEETWVLRDISFDLCRGKKLALIGDTGGGKTSTINLLMRFYDPQKGRVTIDGIDIRNFSISSLRKRISLVLQEIFVFPGTVSQNVNLENPEITGEAVKESSKKVRIDDYIESLEKKYETPMDERGENFSVGQRQLLSFARALARKPQILILDEATSSVDPQNEGIIQDALKTITADRTSLVIAHRLSTIVDADQIISIRRGEIIERGTHEELMKAGGFYSGLFSLQKNLSDGGSEDEISNSGTLYKPTDPEVES